MIISRSSWVSELGGDGGMADFVHDPKFRQLNAGFSLDEGFQFVQSFSNI
jgi:hypothetical protein